jgi:hypothetical protein
LHTCKDADLRDKWEAACDNLFGDAGCTTWDKAVAHDSDAVQYLIEEFLPLADGFAF